MNRLPAVWGATAAEVAAPYPCDQLLPAGTPLWRAVPVRAAPPEVFRWLCQLRAAPYSYDLIDNRGRRSPRRLTPGLDRLEAGQRVMTIFRLVEFERDRHLTLLLDAPWARRLFGEVAVSYVVGDGRLVAKLLVRAPGIRRRLLPWGDLLMMRKQLLTLKTRAEAPAS